MSRGSWNFVNGIKTSWSSFRGTIGHSREGGGGARSMIIPEVEAVPTDGTTTMTTTGNRLAVSRFFACKLGQITRRVGSRGLCLKKERIIDEVTERETIYVLVLFTLYQVRVSRHENIRHVLLLIFCQF